ncbi:MAG: hypothetical protein LBC58_06800 [Clostridiales Family XIII bacterium]|jgi:hypothetical protein|nr:hypothetical protein [Clostridiales Family XIII bacterium]
MQPTASTTGGKEELSQTSVSNSDTFSTLAEDESIKGKVTEETDTEINPSDTPLAGGNGQAFALGTALPIAGAALAAALLSIFLILFLRRRKRNGEGA